MNAVWTILCRDLSMVARNRASWAEPLAFFTIIVILFPLSVSNETSQIVRFGPSIIWIGVLLSGFLSLGRLLRPDYDAGVLEQMMLMPVPLPIILLGKVLAYWIAYGLPLVLLAPVYGSLLFLPTESIWITGLALGVGTLIGALLGLIATSLTVSLQRSEVLIGLLIMPLYLPPVIFGSHIISATISAVPVAGHFAILGAMLVPLLVLAPFFAAVALRIMLD